MLIIVADAEVGPADSIAENTYVGGRPFLDHISCLSFYVFFECLGCLLIVNKVTVTMPVELQNELMTMVQCLKQMRMGIMQPVACSLTVLFSICDKN